MSALNLRAKGEERGGDGEGEKMGEERGRGEDGEGERMGEERGWGPVAALKVVSQRSLDVDLRSCTLASMPASSPSESPSPTI